MTATIETDEWQENRTKEDMWLGVTSILDWFLNDHVTLKAAVTYLLLNMQLCYSATTETRGLSYNYCVWGRVKVEVVGGQPMDPIGWHYENVLLGYITESENGIADSILYFWRQ